MRDCVWVVLRFSRAAGFWCCCVRFTAGATRHHAMADGTAGLGWEGLSGGGWEGATKATYPFPPPSLLLPLASCASVSYPRPSTPPHANGICRVWCHVPQQHQQAGVSPAQIRRRASFLAFPIASRRVVASESVGNLLWSGGVAPPAVISTTAQMRVRWGGEAKEVIFVGGREKSGHFE